MNEDSEFATVETTDDLCVLVGIACDESRTVLSKLTPCVTSTGSAVIETPFPVITGIPCDGWDGAMQLQIVRHA